MQLHHGGQISSTGAGGDPFRTMAGEDIQVPLTIDFMEAVKGAKKNIAVECVTARLELCVVWRLFVDSYKTTNL